PSPVFLFCKWQKIKAAARKMAAYTIKGTIAEAVFSDPSTGQQKARAITSRPGSNQLFERPT
ncbi:MAG: hypothetical protein ACRD3W_00505, partial [Terriglobales bacterium]